MIQFPDFMIFNLRDDKEAKKNSSIHSKIAGGKVFLHHEGLYRSDKLKYE